jgi:RNA polymerase sigma factor (sigma-70 family)
LLRYATGLLRSSDLAQDAVQDAFIRLVKHRRDGRDAIDNLKAWLYRVVHNLALDYIRKNQRFEAMQTSLAETPSRKQENPADATDKRDAEAKAWELLKDLPEREQKIVYLKVIERKSYKEIAQIMDLTVTNIGFILHNSLKKLGRNLTESLS